MTAEKPVDLFGVEITSPEPAPIADGKRRKTVPRGYAAPPGTGPKGETCRSCVHYALRQMGGTYRKCAKVKERWTGGPGTDILAKSPACAFWEKPADAPAPDDPILHPCKFSADRLYRYTLECHWAWTSTPGWQPKRIMWIGLNPSTADERALDPTLKRIESFSKKWGFDAFVMTNLFAFRATDPKDMFAAGDPIGPENDQHLLETAAQCGKIVAAWGAGQLAGAFLLRAGRVRTLLEPFRDRIVCVGTTRDGFPRHPLYVRGDTPPIPFRL